MMNWQSTMPYMHDLMNLPQGPANVPQTYDPFAGSTPQPDLPPAPPMPYAQNNNMYQPVNPVWNTVSPNPFAGGGSGAWDAWIASMNQNGGMQTSAPIGPPMGAPAAAPAPQPAAQPIMEPGMGGIPPAPRPAGNGLSAPLGGGMGMAPRNEPGIGPGGMGMARPPTGMNGMAGPRPSEPFRPMPNPAMPQITPG
ncbi:MAG TPA: hypothetical protein VEI97_06920, partial [bacterium]|nr:hypothetical protein [bacterium]